MEYLHRLVEERIQKAQEDGLFDNLPGKGKPLNLDDDSSIPEDLRLTFKVVKRAGTGWSSLRRWRSPGSFIRSRMTGPSRPSSPSSLRIQNGGPLWPARGEPGKDVWAIRPPRVVSGGVFATTTS